MLQVHQVQAASFIVCRYDLDKKFSELVGYLAFDSDRNLSHSTDDHKLDSDGSLISFHFFGNLCYSIGFITAHSYKSPHHCPAKMMVELVNHKKKTAASIIYFPIAVVCTITPYMTPYMTS